MRQRAAEYLKNGYFSQLDTFILENNSQLDLDGFIGRAMSSSYALKETDEKYGEFKEELIKLFDKYQKDGKIDVNGVTVCYLGKF